MTDNEEEIDVLKNPLVKDVKGPVVFFAKDFKHITFAEAEHWLQTHKREDKSFFDTLVDYFNVKHTKEALQL